MLATSRLLVISDVPRLILAVETSLLCLLGHAPHELVGKDIRILQGPETDTGLLSFALDRAAVMQSQIILHERHGLTALMDSQPAFQRSLESWCKLQFAALPSLRHEPRFLSSMFPNSGSEV